MKKTITRGAKVPMNLKFFGYETDGAGADAGNGGQQTETTPAGADGSAPAAETTKPATFEDFLSQDGFQAEFDRRTQKAINTALTNAREKWDLTLNDKLSEAEKLARMNESERAAYEMKKREKDLTNREAALALKELQATALISLGEKSMDPALAAILDYKDADACKASIDTIERVIAAEVQRQVAELTKGAAPLKAPTKEASSVEQILSDTSASLVSRIAARNQYYDNLKTGGN